jgi:hypothetical protein
MPALVDHVIGAAAAAAIDEIYLPASMCIRVAAQHLIGRGCRIDPCCTTVLPSDGSMRLDCWVQTGPKFIV